MDSDGFGTYDARHRCESDLMIPLNNPLQSLYLLPFLLLRIKRMEILPYSSTKETCKTTQSVDCLIGLQSDYETATAHQQEENAKLYYANYCAFLTDGATTVVHELVHCFVGFLAGDPSVGTPKEVAPDRYADTERDAGESGFEWEKLVFGGPGYLTAYQEKPEHIATAYIVLVKDGWQAAVDPEALRNLVDGSKWTDDAQEIGTLETNCPAFLNRFPVSPQNRRELDKVHRGQKASTTEEKLAFRLSGLLREGKVDPSLSHILSFHLPWLWYR